MLEGVFDLDPPDIPSHSGGAFAFAPRLAEPSRRPSKATLFAWSSKTKQGQDEHSTLEACKPAPLRHGSLDSLPTGGAEAAEQKKMAKNQSGFVDFGHFLFPGMIRKARPGMSLSSVVSSGVRRVSARGKTGLTIIAGSSLKAAGLTINAGSNLKAASGELGVILPVVAGLHLTSLVLAP